MHGGALHGGINHGGVSHGLRQEAHFGAVPHTRVFGGASVLHGHGWLIHPHHFDHRFDGHRFHRHSLWGYGFSYFSGPSYYYRYRPECDPYSIYYDPLYCDRLLYRYRAPNIILPPGTYLAPGTSMAPQTDVDPHTSMALAQTPANSSDAIAGAASTPAAASSIGAGDVPRSLAARIPLISTPDAPDVLR